MLDGARVTALRSEVNRRMQEAPVTDAPFWVDLFAAIGDLQTARSRLDPLAAAEHDLGRRFDAE